MSEATVNTKINLGAGDDKITLVGDALAAMIDGGADTDTLAMTVIDAASASNSATFEANIANFEKLDLTTAATVTTVVDLANMDDINYVITAGSSATAGGVASTESAVVTFTNLTAGQTITIDGIKMTAVADATAIQVAEAFDDSASGVTDILISSGVDAAAWTAADNSGAATVTFTSATAFTNVADLNPTEGNAGQGTNANKATGTATDGVATSSQEKVDFNFTGAVLAVGQQLTFAGATITAKEAMVCCRYCK